MAKVLLVDDDPLVRKSLKRILSREVQVFEAANVRDALRAIDVTSLRYDAIICDYDLGDGTGDRVLEHWCRTRHPARFAFHSGNPQAATYAVKCFAKPARPESILAFVFKGGA